MIYEFLTFIYVSIPTKQTYHTDYIIALNGLNYGIDILFLPISFNARCIAVTSRLYSVECITARTVLLE